MKFNSKTIAVGAFRMGQFAWRGYQALETMEAQRRAREQEARVSQSLIEAERVRQHVENPEASDKLGAGRLATLDDARAENMLDPNGLFIGALDGSPIFYTGDAHLLNYALTRSGKGRDIVLPNLAHVFNRSLVVNDIKDGENHFASAEHRASKGHRIVTLNPHNLRGVQGHKLNPFQRIIDKAGRGESVTEDCLQICMSLVPPSHGDNGNQWVAAGAQQILATWLEWSARFRPERCTLANMWGFVFRHTVEHINDMVDCGCDGIAGQAEKIAQLHGSDDQWNAYESELSQALWNFPSRRTACGRYGGDDVQSREHEERNERRSISWPIPTCSKPHPVGCPSPCRASSTHAPRLLAPCPSRSSSTSWRTFPTWPLSRRL